VLLFGGVAALLLAAGAGARGNPYGSVTRLKALGAAGMFYGADVALSGNGTTALVSDSGYPKGAVWFFRRAIGGVRSTNVKLAGGGFYGSGIALSPDGRTAVIGASGVDAFDGGAWVYTNRGGGVWVGQRLRPTDLRKGSKAQFGDEVAISAKGLDHPRRRPRRREQGGGVGLCPLWRDLEAAGLRRSSSPAR
jgi:hypothetical protein